MEKRHLSYTQLAMFLRCPKQYEFRYMQGLKKPPSGAMVQSRVWHETLEKNYKQKIKTDTDLPLNDMQEFFSAKYDEAFSDEEIVFDTDSNPAKLKDQGVTIVATHHKIIAPTVKPIAVEEKFQISLGEDFPFELMGIWDVIESDGTIVDNKAIYIASSKLSFAPEYPGAGVFKFDDSLVLTKKNMTRSKWNLPKQFKGLAISYHSPNSWKEEGYFQSAKRGQEFVVRTEISNNDKAEVMKKKKEAIKWMQGKL